MLLLLPSSHLRFPIPRRSFYNDASEKRASPLQTSVSGRPTVAPSRARLLCITTTTTLWDRPTPSGPTGQSCSPFVSSNISAKAGVFRALCAQDTLAKGEKDEPTTISKSMILLSPVQHHIVHMARKPDHNKSISEFREGPGRRL